ncbi:tetratricopeptide repeat protein [bacterium]|nr:MAG: tetratricopeptide repeat protein [bacterium]
MKKPEGNLPLLLGAALLLLTAVVYWPATGYGFFAVDDYEYIAENPLVSLGLNWQSVATVFSKPFFNYWIPATWISFMADSALFGPAAGTFHRTNVLLHALNGFLLFWVMKRMTGSLWKSLAVAAIFALHPLRVESVAWITSRKDLLSGAFFFLCLLSWERYARTRRPLWYLLAFASLLIGLMAKPVLVTVPFLLILLDYWPLGRAGTFAGLKNLFLEKIPFFALSIIFSAITLATQSTSIAPAGAISAQSKLADATASYSHYLQKFVWPLGLAFLPRTGEVSTPVDLALLIFALVLVSITAFAWKTRNSSPFILTGWLWYAVSLLPNSGIIPVGLNYMADRFTYIPLIGVSVVFVWGIEQAGEIIFQKREKLVFLASTLPVGALAFITVAQLPHWQSTLAMADRIEAVSSNAAYANELRGFEYIMRREFQKAKESAAIALAHNPSNIPANFCMAEALMELGETGPAEAYLKKALALKPDYAPGLYNYGLILANTGRPGEAVRYFEEALRLSPKNFNASFQLGITLAKMGRPGEAVPRFKDAVESNPGSAAARLNLAMSAAQTGQSELAVEQFRAYLLLNPNDANAHYNLGVLLAGTGQKAEAYRHFSEARRQNPGDPATMEWLSRLQR